VTKELSRRVGAIAPSATLAVSAKAKALKVNGNPVIGFGAGEPDFPTPAHIVEAAVAACYESANHKYSPTPGQPALREAIAKKTLRDSGYEVQADQVVVTNGGKQAVYNALAALLNPGDEMLLPAPYWTTYPEPVRLAGATPVELPTTAESGFRVTIEQLEAARTPNTKALMFVSPSNPTGAVYPKSEIEAIGQWAVEHGIWVLCDEIYEHLVYDDVEHHSMPVLVPELADHCIILNGVAKTYAMTGWRVGWMIGPPALVKAASTLQSHQTSNVCNVAQAAALAAITGPFDAVYEMHAAFDRRRQTIFSMLNEITGVSVIKPQGAFYAFPSFHEVLGREIGGVTPTNTSALADVFLEQINVAIVPGEAFSSPGYGRMAYALSDEDLIEGVTRIGDLLGRD